MYDKEVIKELLMYGIVRASLRFCVFNNLYIYTIYISVNIYRYKTLVFICGCNFHSLCIVMPGIASLLLKIYQVSNLCAICFV